MNTFILVILVSSIIYNSVAINKYLSDIQSYSSSFRNTGLRMIIFKEKKYPSLLLKMKNICENKYMKSMNYLYYYLNELNNLSEDDKLILETITSFLF